MELVAWSTATEVAVCWDLPSCHSSLFPSQYHLSAHPAPHHIKTLLKILVPKTMRDHRLDIQAGLEHHRHLVPGLIHLAAVDSFDRQHIEHHRVPVDGHLLFGNPQH